MKHVDPDDFQGTGYMVAFGQPRLLESDRDAIEYLFPFSVVDIKYHQAPEEKSKTTHHTIRVGITGTLNVMWGLPDTDLLKVLYEYGRRQIVQKLHDHSLASREEHLLGTSNAPRSCPFDPSRISNPEGATGIVPVDIERTTSSEDEHRIGSQIVDALDNINTRFHDSHGDILFCPREFRLTLDLIRPADTREEYLVRVISLANLVDQLNLKALRNLTNTNETGLKSISLLDQYLKSIQIAPVHAINTLRHITRLRQASPVHTDRADGVLDAYKYFELTYPVIDYRKSWKVLLQQFLVALLEIKAIFEAEIDTPSGV